MKKFYAIMAAAVVVTGVASAQLPAQPVTQDNPVRLTGLTSSEASVPATKVMPIASTVQGVSTRNFAPSRADEGTINFKYGDYVITQKEVVVDNEGKIDPFTSSRYPVVITKDENNESDSGVIISNFYFSDVEDMPALVKYEDIQFSDGVKTYPVLKIAAGTPFVNIDIDEDGVEETFGLYLCNSTTIYTGQDLYWVIDETGELWCLFNNSVKLGYFCQFNGQWYGAELPYGINLWEKNAEQTVVFQSSNGYQEVSIPIWTYAFEGNYVDQNDQPTGETFTGVLATGWGLSGETIRFICQKTEEGTSVAVASNQVGLSYEDEPFYFCDIVIENGEPNFAWIIDDVEKLWMVANVGVDGDGNTVFTQDGDWCLFNDQLGITTPWKEAITVFDYYIGIGAESGIKDIEGVDENAPAEYYNLQGVKVANPTPGQLYIVKQGSKVSKVIR